ncbi:MAG: hypothetical protein J7507_04515, partial [Pseudoxanthomonas sp.]|nr:hypothetical protein [Pseudoxanthomonas sp.]
SPLDGSAHAAVVRLEELVLGGGLEGVVLRYGRLYGPDTWTAVPPAQAPVHVDAAADAARRAMTRGAPGIYNIAEDDGVVTSAKARREFAWSPDFRRGVGADVQAEARPLHGGSAGAARNPRRL